MINLMKQFLLRRLLVITPSFLRHAAFFGPEDCNNLTLNIIGVGATGSWVGLLAAKMGWHNFRVWDLDLVESHNLPNQIYSPKHVGMKKVDAFEEVLKDFNPQINIEKYDCFFESKLHANLLDDYVFVAVDSLFARKDIVSCCKNNIMINQIFETQMGFKHATINILDPCAATRLDSYLNLLKNDDEVGESACNERIITTLTSIVSSNVVHLLSALASKDRTKDTFEVPNKIIFNLNPILQTHIL